MEKIIQENCMVKNYDFTIFIPANIRNTSKPRYNAAVIILVKRQNDSIINKVSRMKFYSKKNANKNVAF